MEGAFLAIFECTHILVPNNIRKRHKIVNAMQNKYARMRAARTHAHTPLLHLDDIRVRDSRQDGDLMSVLQLHLVNDSTVGGQRAAYDLHMQI